MKKISPPPVKVPRLNSLLHRLQKNPGPDDESYLDQLMIFLDDPPEGVTDRWKAGADMCAGWGITTSGTSVWRLYNSHLIEWRVRVALNLDGIEPNPQALAEKTEQLVGLRTCELLANPSTPPAVLANLIRNHLLQKYLELACHKQVKAELSDTERALGAMEIRARNDRVAQVALLRFKDALGRPMAPLFDPEMMRVIMLAAAHGVPNPPKLHSSHTPDTGGGPQQTPKTP